jgi:hypothetical protein
VPYRLRPETPSKSVCMQSMEKKAHAVSSEPAHMFTLHTNNYCCCCSKREKNLFIAIPARLGSMS